MRDPNNCFTLILKPEKPHAPIVIRAYDDLNPSWDSAGRVRLTVEVRQGGVTIFPKGFLHCALHGPSDSMAAKELVMALVAMKPGDTDADYFEGYSNDQLAWVAIWGDYLDIEREHRYCDPDTGALRTTERRTRTSSWTPSWKPRGKRQGTALDTCAWVCQMIWHPQRRYQA